MIHSEIDQFRLGPNRRPPLYSARSRRPRPVTRSASSSCVLCPVGVWTAGTVDRSTQRQARSPAPGRPQHREGLSSDPPLHTREAYRLRVAVGPTVSRVPRIFQRCTEPKLRDALASCSSTPLAAGSACYHSTGPDAVRVRPGGPEPSRKRMFAVASGSQGVTNSRPRSSNWLAFETIPAEDRLDLAQTASQASEVSSARSPVKAD